MAVATHRVRQRVFFSDEFCIEHSRRGDFNNLKTAFLKMQDERLGVKIVYVVWCSDVF